MSKKSRMAATIIISFLFSFCFLIGESYDKIGTWQVLLDKPFLSFIKFIGITVTSCIILFYIFIKVEERSWIKKQPGSIAKCIFDKKPLFFPWLIIAFSWLPNYILFFPGCLTIDAMKQLEQFYTGQLTNHHPILTTLIEGVFVSLGKTFGNIDIGVAVYLGIILVLSSGVFALGFRWMSCHKVSYKIRWLGLLYFCLFPLWSSYARTLVKDSLYYPVYFLFILCLFDIIIEGNHYFYSCRKVTKFILICLLLCLVRHNGIYVVLVTLPGIFLFCKGSKRKVSVIIVFLIVFWEVYGAILPILGVSPGGKQEMLSIPFQQTARYIKYHKKEVSREEEQVINKVLDFDNLGDKYDPNLSDPVKNTYKRNDEYLLDYFKVWWKEFLKHPATYIQATLNGTYGYYAYKNTIKYSYGYYKQPVDSELYQKKYHIEFNDKFQVERAKYQKTLQKLFDEGVLKILTQPMFYNWIYFILFVFVIQNKRIRKFWIAFLPFLISFVICLASPVNGDMRYMLPLCSTWIMYLAFYQYQLSDERIKNG